MADRLITPIVAAILAVLVWVYTRSRDQVAIDNVSIPVELQVAGSQSDLYALDLAGPSEVIVSFVGPPSRIRELRSLLHHGELRTVRTITVPEERLADPKYTEVLRVDASEILVPPGVQVVINETQNRIPITMTRMIEKKLQVEFRHTAGDRVSQVVLEPASVTVRGPKEVLDAQDRITHPTELFQVASRNGSGLAANSSAGILVPLAREINGRSVRVTPPVVSVRFVLGPDQKDHELVDVPIHFLTPENFPFRPKFRSERDGFLRLRLRGPASADKPLKEGTRAYVDLTKRTFSAGIQPEEPIQLQLPSEFKLIEPEKPRLPAFELLPDAKSPPG